MPSNDKLVYGVDEGSPDGDKTALSIRVGKKMFTYVGEEAEMLLKWRDTHTQAEVERARVDELNKAYYGWKRSYNEFGGYYDDRIAELEKGE